jgi:hypothetical protein
LCHTTYVNGRRRKFFEILFKPLLNLVLPLRTATIRQASTLLVVMKHTAIVRRCADLHGDIIHLKMEAALTESRGQDADSTRDEKGFVTHQVRRGSSPDHRTLH